MLEWKAIQIPGVPHWHQEAIPCPDLSLRVIQVSPRLWYWFAFNEQSKKVIKIAPSDDNFFVTPGDAFTDAETWYETELEPSDAESEKGAQG